MLLQVSRPLAQAAEGDGRRENTKRKKRRLEPKWRTQYALRYKQHVLIINSQHIKSSYIQGAQQGTSLHTMGGMVDASDRTKQRSLR